MILVKSYIVWNADGQMLWSKVFNNATCIVFMIYDHGSKSRSRPPTRRVPFHIGRGVAGPTWARRAKRYVEGLKDAKKSQQSLKIYIDIKIDV